MDPEVAGNFKKKFAKIVNPGSFWKVFYIMNALIAFSTLKTNKS
jgi:hypothetical protein